MKAHEFKHHDHYSKCVNCGITLDKMDKHRNIRAFELCLPKTKYIWKCPFCKIDWDDQSKNRLTQWAQHHSLECMIKNRKEVAKA